MAPLIRGKRGTVTVLLLMILMMSVLTISFFLEAAAGIASRSVGNGVLNLAARSVLSEYDQYLKNDYGLFGFLMDSTEVSNKIHIYANEAFRKQRGKLNLLNLRVKEVQVDLSPYALTSRQLLEEQIMQHMKYQGINEAISAIELLSQAEDLNRQSDYNQNTSQSADGILSKKHAERTLRNETLLLSLPSRQLESQDQGRLKLPETFSLESLAKETSRDILVNLYLLQKFRHRLDESQWEKTFYLNEVEYVLFGKKADSENRQLTALSLIALRTGINLTHIYSDPLKRDLLVAAATVITPGPGAAGTQILLAGTWAAAEAANDLSRLEKGGKVPLIKTKEDWVLDLQSVIEGNINNTEKPDENHIGLSYENYLFLLLCFQDPDIKLTRIMDLIQLNMQGNYYENFLLKDCYGGLTMRIQLEKDSGIFGRFGLRSGQLQSSHEY